MSDFSIVIPTVGRPSLRTLLDALAANTGPRPARIVLVDDRVGVRPLPQPLPVPRDGWVADRTVLAPVRPVSRRVTPLRGQVGLTGGGGPAAARNAGWRACDTTWVAFLDDDVVVGPSWLDDLAADLAAAGPDVGAVSGRIDVPLLAHRRPTDWERGTAGLATAKWITADLAYRRSALMAVGGFDERFPRAFREDADLALRVQDRGWRLVDGARRTTHPVRPARWRASVDQQRGNADDVLMTRLHGPDWYARAAAPYGTRRSHLAGTAALAVAAAAALAGRRRTSAAAALTWAALTARFAWTRIAPGPRDRAELTRMAVTSALIPPAATAHWLRGLIAHRNAGPWCPPVEGVLFDRDGTLVHDVPYNGRAELVRPVDGARDAVLRLRAAGLKIGVVTNQSGVAKGLIGLDDVHQVNARVDELIGPFDTWQICPHDDADACACRKPQPGMVLAAADALGLDVQRCVVVGDTAADVGAGLAAGAGAILVPNAATRPDEVSAAECNASDLSAAVDAVLARAARSPLTCGGRR